MPILLNRIEQEREQAFQLGYAAHRTGCWLRLLEVAEHYEALLQSEEPAERQTARGVILSLHTLHKAGVLQQVIDGDAPDA